MARWICTKDCRAIGKNFRKNDIVEHATNPDSANFAAYSGDRRANPNLNPRADMDGTLYLGALSWDDLRFPLTGQRLTVTAGRLDYDFEECTVEFGATARYPNEPICMVAQMPHKKYFGSVLHPHLHWVQASSDMPNWLMAYRFYNNGEAVPAFTLAAWDHNAFTYTSGSIMQLTNFPTIASPADENVSAILDIIMYRDSANVSTLFDGADPLSASAAAKEFDLHYQIDSTGSGREYNK